MDPKILCQRLCCRALVPKHNVHHRAVQHQLFDENLPSFATKPSEGPMYSGILEGGYDQKVKP
jgi:hypothetical protein